MKRTEDELFKELLSTSKLEVPTNDFEDQVMMLIKREQVHLSQTVSSPGFDDQIMMQIKKEQAHQKQAVPREIKWSWVGLVLIIALGTTISILFNQLPTVLFDIPLHHLKNVFDLGFIVFVLLQLDALITYTFRGNSHRLNNALRET